MRSFITPGRRRLSWNTSIVSSTFFQRTIEYASRLGSRPRSESAIASSAGSETM